MFNMFIMKKELVNSYCNFVFDIMFQLEKQIDISNYNKYQSRACSYIAEFLLDIWIEKNKLNY